MLGKSKKAGPQFSNPARHVGGAPALLGHHHRSQGPTAQKVHMQVHDLLVCVRAVVHQQAVAGLGHAHGFGDFACRKEELSQDFAMALLYFPGGRNVFFGHN